MLFKTKTTPDYLDINLLGAWQAVDLDKRRQVLVRLITQKHLKKIRINAKELGKWDSSVVVFISAILQAAEQKKIPVQMTDFPSDLNGLIELMSIKRTLPTIRAPHKLDFLTQMGTGFLDLMAILKKGLVFIGQSIKSLGRVIAGTAVFRPVDFFFALEDCGPKAIGIVSLISFMVGLILAFVGALQLKTFGAQIYVASLVAIGMTRIMGAIMTGIIMAGRTGASYAATIGTMQVNEELDALKTMGISRIDFLAVPRLMALMIAMPFLTILSDIMGILGGAFVGVFLLDISWQEYLKYTVDAFNNTNFLVGLFHGFVYGIVIALCGCYYGLNCGRDANSVGQATTRAVVSAIVWMIVMTGVITVIFERMGI